MEHLSRSSTNALRGAACIVILLCHLHDTMTAPGSPVLAFYAIGYLAVGVFFFFSGYNLILGFRRENRVPFGFLRSKLKRVWLPFALGHLPFVAMQCLRGRLTLKPAEFALYALGLRVANTTLWYLPNILIVYLLFFLLFGMASVLMRRLGAAGGKAVMALFSLLLFLALSLVYPPAAEFMEIMSGTTERLPLPLLAGMLYAVFEEELRPFAVRHRLPLLLASLALTCICYTYYQDRLHRYMTLPLLGRIEVYNWFAPLFCALTAVLLIVEEKDSPSRLLSFFGRYSLELYIVHYFFLNLLRADYERLYIYSDYLYLAAYLASTLVGAFALHALVKGIDALAGQKTP